MRRITLPISIIITNFNGEEYISSCLEFLLSSSYQNFEVVIIDDGSTDSSIKIIESFQKRGGSRVKLIKNKQNLGAAKSRNKARHKAEGDILVFLDNDTNVHKDWLTEITKPFSKNDNIGAAQALLLDFENRDLIQMAGGRLIPHVGWLYPFFQWSKYEKIKSKLKNREIVGISAALAVKKEVFDLVKGFDEKEAIYTEDLDLCWRIWVAGHRILLAPDSHVFHWTKSVSQRSGMKASYKQIYFHLAKNSFRSIIKNYEFINVLKYLPVSILINVGRGFLYLLSQKGLDALVGSLGGIVWLFFNLPDTLKARKVVQASRKFNDDYLMKKIFTSENLIQIYNKYFRQ